MTLEGTVFEVGQHWREVDPRVDRVVEIVAIGVERVQIRAIYTGGIGIPRWAMKKRFNGKRGGYRLIEKAKDF